MPSSSDSPASTAAPGRAWSQRKHLAALVGFLVLSEAAGLAGMALGGGPDSPGLLGRWFDVAPGWYASLHKPALQPPGWVFAPVWTTLYALIGVAAWMVWRRRRGPWILAIVLLAVHWVLNVAWTALFFGLHRPVWALVELLALWSVAAAMVVIYWRIRRAAGALLLPYLVWLTFAAVLNAAIVALN
jgi:tryptophan-rich sensory protein